MSVCLVQFHAVLQHMKSFQKIWPSHKWRTCARRLELKMWVRQKRWWCGPLFVIGRWLNKGHWVCKTPLTWEVVEVLAISSSWTTIATALRSFILVMFSKLRHWDVCQGQALTCRNSQRQWSLVKWRPLLSIMDLPPNRGQPSRRWHTSCLMPCKIWSMG